jgi:ADP-heptose:LPS heptosyltransferase
LNAGGLVDEAVELGALKESTEGLVSAAKSFFRLMNRTKRKDFEIFLDFNPRIETQAVCRLGLGSRVVTPVRMPFILEQLMGRRLDVPDRYGSVLRRLGLKPDGLDVKCGVDPSDSARFEQLLTRSGVRSGEMIVLFCSGDAGVSGRHGWGAGNFTELANRISNNFEARAVVADVPHDNAFTNLVGPLLPRNAIRLASPRAAELLAAIARASLFVTDDAGLAELGLSLAVPILPVARSAETPGVEAAFLEACRMLGASRTESLFQRN